MAIRDDVENAGGLWRDLPVVVAKTDLGGVIITSRTPADLTPFCKAIITAMSTRGDSTDLPVEGMRATTHQRVTVSSRIRSAGPDSEEAARAFAARIQRREEELAAKQRDRGGAPSAEDGVIVHQELDEVAAPAAEEHPAGGTGEQGGDGPGEGAASARQRAT